MPSLHISSLKASPNSPSVCSEGEEYEGEEYIMSSIPCPYTWLNKWTKARSLPKV